MARARDRDANRLDDFGEAGAVHSYRPPDAVYELAGIRGYSATKVVTPTPLTQCSAIRYCHHTPTSCMEPYEMNQTGTIKTDLEIRLLAGGVVVAVTRDPLLWQRVLAAITGSHGANVDDLAISGSSDPAAAVDESGDDPVRALANELDVSVAEIQTALAPSQNPPFLRLDNRAWEAFKKNIPSRGRQAVSATALALTALALWFDNLGVDPPRIEQAQAVLTTIHVQGKNPTRSVTNCAWLQQRGRTVVLSPADISRAIAVLRAFCTKTPIEQTD